MKLGDLVTELSRLQADQGPDVLVRISASASGDFEIKWTHSEIVNSNTLWLITGRPVDHRTLGQGKSL